MSQMNSNAQKLGNNASDGFHISTRREPLAYRCIIPMSLQIDWNNASVLHLLERNPLPIHEIKVPSLGGWA